MRSAGWGNRSITRASALSTLPMIALLRIRRILSGRTSCLSTKHPARPIPTLPGLRFPIERAKYPPRSIVRLLRGRSPSALPSNRLSVRNTEGDGTRTSRYPPARASERASELPPSLSLSLFLVDTFLRTAESRGRRWGMSGLPG